MKTIITFLNPRLFTPGPSYYWQEGEEPTPGEVFGLALHRKFPDYDRMLVCCTPEAKNANWQVFHAATGYDPRIRLIEIAKGKNTAEMWEIYDTISAEISEGETVIFDITHGLRSLPFLIFLFAAYLKSAKQVKIEAIYYGAYDLGTPSPVIDLSEFIGILDWLTATDQFVQTGDARRLAALLNPYNENKGKRKVAAETLSEVSLNAFLCQPFKLMTRVRSLEKALLEAEGEMTSVGRPFGVLRDRILHEFGTFKGDFFDDVDNGLRVEYRLIEWYFRNNQWIQAMTLAREWLIDAVTRRLGRQINLEREAREPMEQAVSGLLQAKRHGEEKLNEYGRKLWDWPERELLIEIWDCIERVRNAFAHGEHQSNRMQLSTIKKKVDKLRPLLGQLARQWDMA